MVNQLLYPYSSWPRAMSWADLPEPSTLVAGLVGLPSVQMLVTPLRNALTLGANHPSYPLSRLAVSCSRLERAGGQPF